LHRLKATAVLCGTTTCIVFGCLAVISLAFLALSWYLYREFDVEITSYVLEDGTDVHVSHHGNHRIYLQHATTPPPGELSFTFTDNGLISIAESYRFHFNPNYDLAGNFRHENGMYRRLMALIELRPGTYTVAYNTWPYEGHFIFETNDAAGIQMGVVNTTFWIFASVINFAGFLLCFVPYILREIRSRR